MIRLGSSTYQVSNLPSTVFIVLVDIVKFSLETVDRIYVPIKNRPGMVEHLSQLLCRLKWNIHKLEPGKLSEILSQKSKIERIVSRVQRRSPGLASVRPWVRSPLL